MSRRNPMNDRYQAETRKAGGTRKSAASAKPSKKAASSIYVRNTGASAPKRGIQGLLSSFTSPKETVDEASVSTKKTGDPKAARKAYFNPRTSEYRKWRIVWWAMIICGVLTILPSFLVPNLYSDQPDLANLLMFAASGLILGAIALDATKIRKIRNASERQAVKKTSKKAR